MPIIAVFLIALLTACGFTPVYQVTGQTETKDQLAAIAIDPVPGRTGQLFRMRLESLLNPTAATATPLYRLTLTLESREAAVGIQQDRSATRFNVHLRVKYKLISLADNKVLDQGNIKVTGGYNRMESEYATYASQQDSTRRIYEEGAEELRMRLAMALMQ